MSNQPNGRKNNVVLHTDISPYIEPGNPDFPYFHFKDYGFSRDKNGTMLLKIYTDDNKPLELAKPNLDCAVAIDLLLQNKTLSHLCYYGNESIGYYIHAMGPISGVTAIYGTQVETFDFLRAPTDDYRIMLRYRDGAHGGWDLSWELTHQVLRAACWPNSCTMKVVVGPNETRLLICDHSYEIQG